MSSDVQAQSNSERRSVHSENRAEEALPEEVPPPPSLLPNERSVLDVSEIIGVLSRNQSEALSISLSRCFSRTQTVITVFWLYLMTAVAIEAFSLHRTLTDWDHYRAVFFFLKTLSDPLIFYVLFLMRFRIREVQRWEISSLVTEYLQHTLRTSELEEEEEDEDEEELTTAQKVARRISKKIGCFHLIGFLVGEKLNFLVQLIIILQTLLFVFGNSIFAQSFAHDIQAAAILYVLAPGYLLLFTLTIAFVVICLTIPIIACIVIWQLCCGCIIFQRLWLIISKCRNARQVTEFLNSLRTSAFGQIVESENFTEECAICLSQFELAEQVTVLPCNVKLGNGQQINHIFHTACIQVWVREQGNCPICRKRFIEIIHD